MFVGDDDGGGKTKKSTYPTPFSYPTDHDMPTYTIPVMRMMTMMMMMVL
jgi:hypothetical protein